ncbi:MAG: hypothetical protein OXC31_19210, partial [Spirochaetaceae bacterium]|nr:hypothetical protein [Spirochaetaceae bacterium]
GFDEADNALGYVRLVVWLGRLGLGYGLAIGYLAEVMNVDGDLDSQVTELLERSARVMQDRHAVRPGS